MSAFLAVFQRELRAYFVSPMAYVVLAFFLLVNGYVFSIIVAFLSDPRAAGSTTPLKLFFGDTFFFWLVLLFITPVLTMRLISEEIKSGTIESLMTAPITDTQVVLAKYLASVAFYVFLWVPTLVYVAIVGQSSELDPGPVVAGYIGVLGIGSVFLAVGLFASSFTRSQIMAAIATFGLLMFFFALAFLESLVSSDSVKDVLGYMNLLEHMNEFSRGIVDTRRLVYYFSTIVLFLFLTVRSLESKKWR